MSTSAPESPALTEGTAPAPAAGNPEQSPAIFEPVPPQAEASSSIYADWEDFVPWDPSDTLPSSCVGNAEFVPLGRLPDGSPWRAVDPESRYLYWSDERQDSDGSHERWFRWTQEQGITLIGEYVNAYVLLPSDDGNVLVGSHFVEGTLTGGFRWTQTGGTTPLDFVPYRVDASGDVIVGAGEQGLVRWSVNGGKQIVDAGVSLSSFGGLAVAQASDVIVANDLDGRLFRWTETEGRVDLGALEGPRSHAALRGISASGDVIFGLAYDDRDVMRPFRWTAADGIHELDVPADTPDDASAVISYMSTDGRVVVGQLRLADPNYSYPFRWTEDTGMQELLPREQTTYATYLSPSGDVVMGNFGDSNRGFRWTEATGLEEIDAPWWPGIAADGDLVVGTNAEGPYVHAYGELAGTQPEILSLAPLGALPEGWSQPRLEGISEDGRMMFGRARDPSGRRRAWLLHPSEGCTRPRGGS